MLIQIYIFSLVLSAILLMASLLLGERRPDPDGSLRTTSPCQPLRSARFWTLCIAFFGMAGLLLDGLDILPAWPALGAASLIALLAAITTAPFTPR